MRKEAPNSKLFFDDKIARVIFEDDMERKVYWLDVSEFRHPRHHRLSRHYLLSHLPQLPIEEWLKENNISYPFDEDGLFQFKMRWL